MNQMLSNFAPSKKPVFFLFLLSMLFAFQSGNAQHCFPGFHFSVLGNTVAFSDQSTAQGNITTYSWDFGDGETSAEQNPSHIYATPGTYNVCLTITAHNPSCSATYCHHVVVVHPPAGVCHAAFAAHQPDPAIQTIVFTDQSTSDGTIGSWAWDFGDGHTSGEQNPSHTYAEPGTYLVCLTITDDDGICTSHVCYHVVVHHPPAGVCHAAFAAHQFDPAHQTIVFTDQSTSDGTIGFWAWDFGDGNTSAEQNPSHTYTEAGTYLVCLTITDDDGICTSHVCHHVVVHHPLAGVCHAAFTAHQPDPANPTIIFTDQSTSDGTIGSWAWDFGDGHTSAEQNPSHTYAEPGTYLVCLFITDADGGCTSHVCKHVVVNHPPAIECHAAFTIHKVSNLGIQFTNTSSGTTTHTTYIWEFGDGVTSTEENPLHIYAHPGQYTVCLFIADTTTGCSSHICHNIYIHHNVGHHYGQKGATTAPRAETLSGQTISSSDLMVVYPNPVVSVVNVVYQLPVAAVVKFELYNMTGVRVAALAESTKMAGEQIEIIPVGNLLSGAYILKMTVDGKPQIHRVVVQQSH
jgi:PKD repeat protein